MSRSSFHYNFRRLVSQSFSSLFARFTRSSIRQYCFQSVLLLLYLRVRQSPPTLTRGNLISLMRIWWKSMPPPTSPMKIWVIECLGKRRFVFNYDVAACPLSIFLSSSANEFLFVRVGRYDSICPMRFKCENRVSQNGEFCWTINNKFLQIFTKLK